MAKPIFYMVANVLNEYGNILEVILYDYRSDTCFKFSYTKVVELLKSGICIGNLKLNKRFKLEAFPKECGFHRYYSLDEDNKVKSDRIYRVLISSHKTQNGEQYTLFNNKTNKCETVDKRFVTSRYDKYSLISNTLELDSNIKNMFNSYYNYKIQKSLKELNIENSELHISLNGYGNLESCITTDIYNIPECIWINNINKVNSKNLVVNGSIYGIGYRAINNIKCDSIDILEGVKEIEVESIINCNVEWLKLPRSLTKVITNSIVNSKFNRFEIYGNTLIKENFMSNCEINELVIYGSNINFDNGIKELVNNCNLHYILVDSKLDNKSMDILYNICEKDVIILTNEK